RRPSGRPRTRPSTCDAPRTGIFRRSCRPGRPSSGSSAFDRSGPLRPSPLSSCFVVSESVSNAPSIPGTEQSRCRAENRGITRWTAMRDRAACPRSGAETALCPMVERGEPGNQGCESGLSSAGRHADAPPGPDGLRSALRRETLPLHVAPQLLGHLGWTNRLGAEQRFQAVRTALEADRVASESFLLSPRALLLGVPPFFVRNSGPLKAMTTMQRGHDKEKARYLGGALTSGRPRGPSRRVVLTSSPRR